MSNTAAKSVENIKRAAMAAVNASMPAGVYFGTVVSVKPLKISVEQKMILSEKQLVLSSLVLDFRVEIGQVSQSVHLALKSGEKVILIREQGGQKYVVFDRIRG